MSTCFIYCRKSSEDKERQILSLDDQEKICTELAQDKGFVVLGVYRESKSAKRPDQRPEFSALLSRMLKNEAKHIICWKADRLCRNAKEGGTLIDKVDYEGMQIITPTMDYDRNNSTFLFIEFGMATKFSKDLSDNVKRGMNTKVQNGWRPGRAPLGYKNDYYKPKGQKEVLPDLDKFDLCRKWWELMLSGTETVESSLEKISALGLKSNLTNQAVSKTEAFRYFRNIFYTGFFEYNGERHQGKHRAMITLDEYLRVQDIMNGRTRVHQVTNDFYFMKTLSCGECGSAITCDRKFKKYKNGTTQTFIYARCVKKKGPCSQHYVNAIELEKQVTEFINSLEIKPAFINWLRKMLKKRNDREFEFERAQKTKLTKRLDAILLEKKNVYGMKIEGLIGDEEYQAEKKRLLVEEKQTKDIIDSDGLEAWTQTMEEFLAFSSKIIKVFNGYDTEAKRMVLKIIGSNLILKDRLVRLNGQKAFVFLKEAEKTIIEKNARLEPKNSASNRSNSPLMQIQSDMERGTRIELASLPWEGSILPVY